MSALTSCRQQEQCAGESPDCSECSPNILLPAACGSGTLPLNSQTKQISGGFPPARGNTSCIASCCSLALLQLQSPPLPWLTDTLGWCHQGISPSGVLLNPAFHGAQCRFGYGHIHSGVAKVPGQEIHPLFPPAQSPCYKPQTCIPKLQRDPLCAHSH